MSSSQTRSRAALLLIAAGVLVLISVFSVVMFISHSQVIATEEQQITQLKKQLKKSNTDKITSLASTGEKRVTEDKRHIEHVLNKALTWDDQDSYEAARNLVLKNTKLTKKDSFFTQFMPEAPVKVDAKGNKYSYIEQQGLESSLFEADVVLTQKDTEVYHYVVNARVAHGSDAYSYRSVLFKVATTPKGIVSVEGYPTTHEARET